MASNLKLEKYILLDGREMIVILDRTGRSTPTIVTPLCNMNNPLFLPLKTASCLPGYGDSTALAMKSAQPLKTAELKTDAMEVN